MMCKNKAHIYAAFTKAFQNLKIGSLSFIQTYLSYNISYLSLSLTTDSTVKLKVRHQKTNKLFNATPQWQ